MSAVQHAAPDQRREDQRSRALVKANEKRLAIAALKRRIHEPPGPEGRCFVADLIEQMEWPVDGMCVGVLLRSIRKVGWSRSKRWIGVAKISSMDRKLSSLSQEQRSDLVAELRRGQS